jgi:hypothetical protein
MFYEKAESETMAQERRNPLPIGQYWVDVFAKDEEAFNAWLFRHKDAVSVLRSESHPETDPPWNWMLFDVTSPVRWDGPGFPTISKGETGSSDTAQRPEAPLPIDEQLENAVESASASLNAGLTIAGLGLAGFVLWKLLS